MGVRFKGLVSLLVLAASATVFIPSGLAQTASPEVSQLGKPTIPEALNQAANFNNFYKDRSTAGDALFTFGLNGFDEAKIAKAARRTEALYLDLLQQQNEDNPIVRTRDLANPYETSLLQLNNQSLGNEFVFERQSP